MSKLLLVQRLRVVAEHCLDGLLLETKKARANIDKNLSEASVIDMTRENSIHAGMTDSDSGKGDVDCEDWCSGGFDQTVDVASAVDGQAKEMTQPGNNAGQAGEIGDGRGVIDGRLLLKGAWRRKELQKTASQCWENVDGYGEEYEGGNEIDGEVGEGLRLEDRRHVELNQR